MGEKSGLSTIQFLPSGKSSSTESNLTRFAGVPISTTNVVFDSQVPGRTNSASWQGAVGPAVNLLRR